MSDSISTRALARRWWLVPIVLAVSLATAWTLTARQRPTYRATTAVVVIPNGVVVEAVRDFIDGLANLDRRSVVATLARVTHSTDIVDRAAERITLSSSDRSRCVVRSIVLPNTNIIEIEVEGPSPEGCANLANAIASVAASETVDLYRIYRMKVLDVAVPSRRPVSPDLQRNLLVAAILGLVGGLLLGAAVDWTLRAMAKDRGAA
jgi:capsular polysaccharide biosynthesis protein